MRPIGAAPYRTTYDFYLSFPLLREIIIQLSQLNPQKTSFFWQWKCFIALLWCKVKLFTFKICNILWAYHDNNDINSCNTTVVNFIKLVWWENFLFLMSLCYWKRFLSFHSDIVRISFLLGDQDDKKKKTYILRPKGGRTYKDIHDFVEKN